MSEKRRIVSFELPVALWDALLLDTQNREGASHHLRAREMVIERLLGREFEEVCKRLDEVDASISFLQGLMKKTTYSVIVHAAKQSSSAANQWIAEHMTR